ncbi:MAG: hypothetical protein WCI73_15155, partial [Phycisphaerae bacterium]
MVQHNWHGTQINTRKLTDIMNNEFAALDAKYSDCLPDLRGAKTLLLGSDYSGDSPDSPYLVYSFL